MATQQTEFRRALAVIEQGMQAGLHVGAQLYVSRQGVPLIDRAFGLARPEVPMGRDALMLWRSSGKPITAVAIARQVEEGRLHWDEPVSRHIPEFGSHGKEALTIRHLLTHTGGFRGADQIPEGLDWEETIHRICQTPREPNWSPGEAAGYHLTGSWFVLAELIHRIDGRPFDRYVRQEIFEPCGMHDSWIGMPREQYHQYGSRIGFLYMTERPPPKPHPVRDSEAACTQCRPGSHSRGPIRELGRFYERLLKIREGTDPSPLIRPETLQTLTRRHRVGMFDQTFRHVVDWGLGFTINSSTYGVDTVPYGYGRYASEPTFGHGGAQSSMGFLDPEHALVVAWLLNGTPGERRHQERVRALNDAIYEDLGLTS